MVSCMLVGLVKLLCIQTTPLHKKAKVVSLCNVCPGMNSELYQQ